MGKEKRDGDRVRTVCPSLHQVANVHDYGVSYGRSVDKLSWFVWIFNLDYVLTLFISYGKKLRQEYIPASLHIHPEIPS